MPRIRFTVAALLIVAVVALVSPSTAHASSVNLVTNGDFSAGNVGFGSDYVYHAPNGGDTNLWDPGVFSVDVSALNDHALWVTSGDHTTGTGNFMMANGYTDRTDRDVWTTTISVDQNTDYFFEAFANNLCCRLAEGFPAGLTFLINGFVVGSWDDGLGAGVWSGISNRWNSGTSNTAVLSVRDGVTVHGGNDFGLDDIYFGTESQQIPTPEPASLVLLTTGIVGFGVRKYRGRRSA